MDGGEKAGDAGYPGEDAVMNKYHNQKTVVDSITFDSKAEAARFFELKLLERAGKISELKLQPEFPLLDDFAKNGKKVRGIKYVADFIYIENGKIVVEDVKGMETREFKIKRKLFESKYRDLTLTIIK